MRLYFMRHADAVQREAWSGEDAARPLTDKGRQQAAAAGSGLAKLRPGIDAIISSPFSRAYETAVIVGKAIGLPVESSDALTPGFDLPRLDHAISMRPVANSALYVGHEPDLSALIKALVRGDEGAGVTMKKASCCLVVTPADVQGGESVVELQGRCELGWLRSWRELSALTNDEAEGG